jgi:hypothetical protein
LVSAESDRAVCDRRIHIHLIFVVGHVVDFALGVMQERFDRFQLELNDVDGEDMKFGLLLRSWKTRRAQERVN